MKQLSFVIAFSVITLFVNAQDNPVHWSFSSKKTGDKTYEVRFTASVAAPWHIYSQHTPDGGPIPSSFHFANNPLVSLEGPVKEIGDLKQKHEDVFGIDVKYFNGNVEFVQVVKLKANAKTNLAGKLEFMTCNDTQCKPPIQVPFNISLQ
jgi:thiol:disulfide interchange protein DsbD